MGRLAARCAGVPVIASALHSTGWPDGIGRLNRLLTPITDAFVAVAPSHGRFLIEEEHLPARKVVVVPNGVDTHRFRPEPDVAGVREKLGVDRAAPVVAIVAALRPEKNHELCLDAARRMTKRLPRGAVPGDWRRTAPRGARSVGGRVWYRAAGGVPWFNAPTCRGCWRRPTCSRSPRISRPTRCRFWRAMSVGLPVVATNVGSVAEAVCEGETGYLVPPGNADALAERLVELLEDPQRRAAMGIAGRERVARRWSVDVMVAGYEELIASLYERKTGKTRGAAQSHSGTTPRRTSRCWPKCWRLSNDAERSANRIQGIGARQRRGVRSGALCPLYPVPWPLVSGLATGRPAGHNGDPLRERAGRQGRGPGCRRGRTARRSDWPRGSPVGNHSVTTPV